MTGYAGKNVYALVGVESTFNTEATTIDKPIAIINNLTPDLNNNNNSTFEIGNRESAQELVGNFDGTISIDGQLNSGAIFELMFGQSTDAETTGDYEHTIIDSAGSEVIPNTAASFSVTENISGVADFQFTYTGCKVNTIDISVDQGGTLDFSSEVILSNVTQDASVGTQVSVPTEILSGFQAVLSTGTDGAEATQSQVKDVGFSITQNIDAGDVKAIGSRLNQCLIEKNLNYTVDFTVVFSNTTEYDRFLGGTTPATNQPEKTAIKLAVSNGVTLGAGRIAFDIELSNGQYNNTNRSVSTDGVVEATFSYTGGNLNLLKFTDQTNSYF